ncbi:MAG: hypothetical protein QM757_19620 [Paludibaculum sp.]
MGIVKAWTEPRTADCAVCTASMRRVISTPGAGRTASCFMAGSVVCERVPSGWETIDLGEFWGTASSVRSSVR